MEISLNQKMQLFFVFILIKLLWWLDDIIGIFRKAAIFSTRTFLYIFIVSVLLTGFYLQSFHTGLSSLPLTFNPKPEVLGAIEKKGPVLVVDIPFPIITSKAVYVVETNSEKVLVDLNGSQIFPPASITKLMTALVAIDLYSMEDNLSIPEFCTQIEGQKAGLQSGEGYTVLDLLSSMLISSSADAACTLSVGKISYNDFVNKMNEKAQEFNLENTSFTNPIGLDAENGSHLSTAFDLYILARKSMDNETIRQLVGTKEKIIEGSLGTKTQLVNTNDLLWERTGVVGIKTGRTEAAGEVLVIEYKALDSDIILTLMQSENRFEDARKILDWVEESYNL